MFKIAMTKAIQTEKQSWRSALHNFLITYCITPHTSMGKPPSELLMTHHLQIKQHLIHMMGQEETIKNKKNKNNSLMKKMVL